MGGHFRCFPSAGGKPKPAAWSVYTLWLLPRSRQHLYATEDKCVFVYDTLHGVDGVLSSDCESRELNGGEKSLDFALFLPFRVRSARERDNDDTLGK